MFGFGKKEVVRTPRFIVFIAMLDGEGIAEDCPSHDEMMKQYFRYCNIVQKETWITITDGMIRTERIKYIRWTVQ